eukprot:Hpha_TRINITY_DN3933_c0_g1::TRINITY_DN3933_c0_g1_i1::g.18077::m.18077
MKVVLLLLAAGCTAAAVLGGNSTNNKCHADCKSDAECNQGGDACLLCMQGKCETGCAQACETDAQCNSACPRCDPDHKQCKRKPSTCLGLCFVNEDCEGNCSLCFAKSPNPGQCGVGCGQNCTTDAQCKDTLCPVCAAKKCVGKPPVSP